MQRQSLRVGVVGFGEAGQIHVRHLKSAGADVVGVVTRRQDLKVGLPIYPSLEALLPEVEAVTIAVPNHFHAPYCLQAVRAGKVVFVEKPLCIARHELSQLEEALQSMSRPVKVGFRLRWSPSLRVLRAKLYRVHRVSCIYRLGIEELAAGKDWTRRQAESGGAVFTLGVHALDLARWLIDAQGEPLQNLRVHADSLGPSADFPLNVVLSGKLSDGREIVAGADLRGNASFFLDLQIDAQRGFYPDPSLPSPRPEEEGAADVEYQGLINDFVEAAIRGTPNPEEILEYLQTHRELVQAQEMVKPTPSTLTK